MNNATSNSYDNTKLWHLNTNGIERLTVKGALVEAANMAYIISSLFGTGVDVPAVVWFTDESFANNMCRADNNNMSLKYSMVSGQFFCSDY